ncbi:hypothetical protein Tco_1420711 [Tanacetum coccineum]
MSFPQLDSGLVVPSFLPGDDPIACLNKAMAFMSTVMASRLLFNKYKGDRVRVLLVQELREMLQAIMEIMQQVKQGLLSVTIVRVKGIWQLQSALRQFYLRNLSRNSDGLNKKTDDLRLSRCDDISLAKAVLMANLSSYDSEVLSEVPHHDTYQNDDMINQSVQEMKYSEQSLIDYVPDNDIISDSNIISYEHYLKEMQNPIVQDTNSPAQQDAMIMFVFEQMSTQVTKCTEATKKTQNFNESLIAELERY